MSYDRTVLRPTSFCHLSLSLCTTRSCFFYMCNHNTHYIPLKSKTNVRDHTGRRSYNYSEIHHAGIHSRSAPNSVRYRCGVMEQSASTLLIDNDHGLRYFLFFLDGGSIIMTSSNGIIFHVTGPLYGEFTGHRWILLTKASDAELSYFSLICAWINGGVNNRGACYLWRHRAHYDVAVMGLVQVVWDVRW